MIHVPYSINSISLNSIKPWILYQCTDMPSTKAELLGLNLLLTICLDAFYLIFKLSIKAPLFKIFFIIPGTFIKFSIAALLCFYKQEYWSYLMGTCSYKWNFSLDWLLMRSWTIPYVLSKASLDKQPLDFLSVSLFRT